MSNGDTTIICGTAGEEQGTVQITMFRGSVFGIAAAFDPHAARTYPGVSDRDIARLKRTIDRAYGSIVEEFERLNIPYTKHDHPPPQ